MQRETPAAHHLRANPFKPGTEPKHGCVRLHPPKVVRERVRGLEARLDESHIHVCGHFETVWLPARERQRYGAIEADVAGDLIESRRGATLLTDAAIA
jgi:hypothetical protein